MLSVLHATPLSGGSRLTVVDPLWGRAHPVVLDRWPVGAPWEAVSDAGAVAPVRKRRRRARDVPEPQWADDPYCDAELLAECAQQVRAFARGAEHMPWWTRRADVRCIAEWTYDAAVAPMDRLLANASAEQVSMPLESTDESATLLQAPRSARLYTDLLPASGLPDSWAGLESLVRRAGGVDLVLIDPPWPNRSAARARTARTASSYETLTDLYDVWRLRPALESLLATAPDGVAPLVALWVTNHPKVRAFAEEKFLPGFGLGVLGAWAWLKVAADEPHAGEPLLSLRRPAHRRPYELLLLAQRGATGSVADTPRHVVASAALAHSQKPDLRELLLQVHGRRGGRGRVVVELFARHAPSAPDETASGQPHGWHISVGKEAAKFDVVPRETATCADASADASAPRLHSQAEH